MCAKKASRYFAFATFFLSFAPGASFGSGKRVPHTAHSRSECFSKTARQTEQVYPMSRWRLVSVHTARVSSLDCGGGAIAMAAEMQDAGQGGRAEPELR